MTRTPTLQGLLICSEPTVLPLLRVLVLVKESASPRSHPHGIYTQYRQSPPLSIREVEVYQRADDSAP